METHNAEQQQLAASMRWESESQRLKKLTGLAGDDLLRAGLNGRQLSSDNVVMLWHAITRAFSDSVKAMSFSNPGIEVCWGAICPYLRRESWSQTKLNELEQSRPWWTGSVLDEIEEQEVLRKNNG
jgi:hypothetical protein